MQRMPTMPRPIRPRPDPHSTAEPLRAIIYRKRIDGLIVALRAAAARDDTAAVERIERLIAAYENCILTGEVFGGWNP